MLNGMLKGGKKFWVDRDDIAKQQLERGSSPRPPRAYGFTIYEDGGSLYISGTVGDVWMNEVLSYMDLNLADLRANKLKLKYTRPDKVHRTLVVTLTDKAHAELNVWLDSMLERDLIAG